MRMRIVIVPAPIVFALALCGCTNTQPAYYGTYPSNYSAPNHGYEPYTIAPYDPYAAYYQNYGPATPYFYEPPESHRDCENDRPCIAYRRNADAHALEPEIIALPEKNEPLNPPSTISRPQAQRVTPRHRHTNEDSDH